VEPPKTTQVKATRTSVRRGSADPGRRTPYPFPISASAPGGVVFASWPTASVIRREVERAVAIAGGRMLVGTRGALLECFLAIAFEHQVGGTPDIDLGYHATKDGGL
jgi:hypothetical protein